MVVPIRDIGNKSFSTSATTNSDSRMALPTNIGMDIDNFIGSNANNYDDMRGHTITSNKTSFRSVSMSSSEALVDYATRMEYYNNFPKDEETRELL